MEKTSGSRLAPAPHRARRPGGAGKSRSSPPPRLIERLAHYFATYKLVPGQESQVSVRAAYNSATAQEIVAAAIEDYQEVYGEPQGHGE